MDFVPASDRSLLVRTRDVFRLLRSLQESPIPGLVNLHPAYESILLVFDPFLVDHAAVERDVLARAATEPPESLFRSIEIPVRYDGPDLAFVADYHGLTTKQVVELHSSATYCVRFLGFLPGFAYLSGLPDGIATPRLDAPRIEVPAGSVGIAGGQTGVYPVASPGGWRLIGQTDREMFRLDRPGYSLLQPGDTVRFVPA